MTLPNMGRFAAQKVSLISNGFTDQKVLQSALLAHKIQNPVPLMQTVA